MVIKDGNLFNQFKNNEKKENVFIKENMLVG